MKFTILFSLLILSNVIFSQERTICPDVEGALEHPLINKFNNSCIVAYSESKFNAVTFPISKITSNEGAENEITEEGKIINLIYGIQNTERATVLEVQKNYEQALKNGNFEILHSAFGKKNISGYYKIQNVYETFGDVDVVDEYQFLKPKATLDSRCRLKRRI